MDIARHIIVSLMQNLHLSTTTACMYHYSTARVSPLCLNNLQLCDSSRVTAERLACLLPELQLLLLVSCSLSLTSSNVRAHCAYNLTCDALAKI